MTPTEKPQPLAMKEQLDQIAATVATIAQHQQKDADTGLLLADCRDTITEAVGALHSQGADILHGLQMLHTPPASIPGSHVRLWRAGAGGVLLGCLLMGAVWWAWPEGGHRTFAVALDAILVQYHGHLPQQAQDAITALYHRYQLQTPGSRQKGRS
jgi:hypothetical protein